MEAGGPYCARSGWLKTGESAGAPSEVIQGVIGIFPTLSGTWIDAEVRLRRCHAVNSRKEGVLVFVTCMIDSSFDMTRHWPPWVKS